MPRELKDRDLEILFKVAPELKALTCGRSGVEFRSIFPPLANHISTDVVDFAERLDRLDIQDLLYLADKIAQGEESLGCLDPDYALIFFRLLESRLSPESASQARQVYERGECEL